MEVSLLKSDTDQNYRLYGVVTDILNPKGMSGLFKSYEFAISEFSKHVKDEKERSFNDCVSSFDVGVWDDFRIEPRRGVRTPNHLKAIVGTLYAEHLAHPEREILKGYGNTNIFLSATDTGLPSGTRGFALRLTQERKDVMEWMLGCEVWGEGVKSEGYDAIISRHVNTPGTRFFNIINRVPILA